MLKLSQAFQLYVVIKPFLPKEKNLVPLDFIGVVVDNILAQNKSGEYLKMVSILTNSSVETLLQFPPAEVVNICIKELIENRIYELIGFCEQIGL